jgi:nitroreductase
VLDTHLWNDAWSEAAIAAHTILLGATEAGLGGSLVTGVDRARLKAELQLSDRYNVLVVVALGRPKEDVRVASTSPTQELRRYRDDSGTAFVPKRSLNELILADLPRES